MNITFANNIKTKKFILSLLGKGVNEDNVIIDEHGIPVIDIDKNEITLDDFGIMASGSELFVKDNLVSLIKYNEKYTKK